jgi:hypothetical protein
MLEKSQSGSAFLPVVGCFSPASAFRHQGSVRDSWSQISPALPSYAGIRHKIPSSHQFRDCSKRLINARFRCVKVFSQKGRPASSRTALTKGQQRAYRNFPWKRRSSRLKLKSQCFPVKPTGKNLWYRKKILIVK